VIVVRLALLSLWNRRGAALLTLLAIALSVAMLLGVEKMRRDARGAFANTLSGTDLIVGARGGAIPLLLYSVFRIGDATNNVSWRSYQAIAALPRVRWSVPLSLGDSYRGHRVLGTTEAYFEHYRHGRGEALRFAHGRPFRATFETVLGSEVAGMGVIETARHTDHPFEVTGILARTGTPVDRTVHVSLAGIEAIHVGWEGGTAPRGPALLRAPAPPANLTPASITAFLLGLDSRIAVFATQRAINEYRGEPLQAIVPGVALQRLWDLLGTGETALRGISVVVVVTGVLGMLSVLLAGTQARRREMAVLRSVGARPLHVFALFLSESTALAVGGAALGVALLYAGIAALRPLAAARLGLDLPPTVPTGDDALLLAAVVLAVSTAGLLPALRAYRLSLHDGLTPTL
jgi:putative ABC transport system permease protein